MEKSESRRNRAYLKKSNIEFVPQLPNHLNCSQLRSIKKFCAILKSTVYVEGAKPKSEADLVRKIKKSIKNLDPTLMSNLHKKARNSEDGGIFSVFR